MRAVGLYAAIELAGRSQRRRWRLVMISLGETLADFSLRTVIASPAFGTSETDDVRRLRRPGDAWDLRHGACVGSSAHAGTGGGAGFAFANADGASDVTEITGFDRATGRVALDEAQVAIGAQIVFCGR